MWDYTRTYIYVYICGALILPAFAYIICMLTSACVCVWQRVREWVRSCSCCRWGVHVLGWHINPSLSSLSLSPPPPPLDKRRVALSPIHLLARERKWGVRYTVSYHWLEKDRAAPSLHLTCISGRAVRVHTKALLIRSSSKGG
jgi:hypothetical protein